MGSRLIKKKRYKKGVPSKWKQKAFLIKWPVDGSTGWMILIKHISLMVFLLKWMVVLRC